MSGDDFIIYTTDDGKLTLQLRTSAGSVWLTQKAIAKLFDRDVTTINQHIRSIYEDGECSREATVGKSPIVQTEGDREVSREVEVYNLDVILAVGFRVKSSRGVQFRRWANTTLKEYLIKGFVMDDARLKDPKFDYFDELLERIRDIRASEAQFYRKLRDILSLSEDYEAGTRIVDQFYATIQNKMLYAVTHHTAAELIAARSDASAPNMGLTTWKHGRVRKSDVTVAKNYLGDLEIRELNQIVTMFLDTADLRASRRQTIRLAEWEGILDRFLVSNELPVLHGHGNRSKISAENIAHERYAEFDTSRRDAERARAAQEPDIDVSAALAQVERSARQKRPARKLKT